ncbi:hypothetical protein [Streptomyces sp. NPDC090022]|uniref:hypothetical protein n=1 Tax=Streptomyces sp. NPDC090022 TaxID=3365920 RepID=UPI0038053D58
MESRSARKPSRTAHATRQSTPTRRARAAASAAYRAGSPAVALALDVQVPGRRAAVIENLGSGELVGCSWLFKPYTWRLGAEAMTPVRAYEFDAAWRVRRLMDADPDFGPALGHWVGQVLAHRLQAARIRLLDLYAPYGSGSCL